MVIVLIFDFHNVLNEMSVFRPQMHRCGLQFVLLTQNCINNDGGYVRSEREKQLPILVYFVPPRRAFSVFSIRV